MADKHTDPPGPAEETPSGDNPAPTDSSPPSGGDALDAPADRDDDGEHRATGGEAAEGDAGAATDPRSVEEAGGLSPARHNRLIPGIVTLEYPERRVKVVCDGEAALRILARCADGDRDLEDRLTPGVSSAARGWVVFDPHPLVATWLPVFDLADTASEREYAVVDPA